MRLLWIVMVFLVVGCTDYTTPLQAASTTLAWDYNFLQDGPEVNEFVLYDLQTGRAEVGRLSVTPNISGVLETFSLAVTVSRPGRHTFVAIACMPDPNGPICSIDSNSAVQIIPPKPPRNTR